MTGITLVIAEKPELARAIAEVVGPGKRGNGYIDCGQHIITWCFGHMLELVLPPNKEWAWEKLPYSFMPWHRAPIEKSRDQLQTIKHLLGRASRVIHAGDPDEEGQLLIDEVLDWAGCRLPVERLLINDNNPKIVRRALDSLRPNSDFLGMSKAAEARQVADAMYGVNMTRGYTLAAQARGHDGVLTVGRVQTPILGLVVRRDREHAGHSKTYFYQIEGQFLVEGRAFKARYQIRPGDPVDDKGRLRDEAHSRAIAQAVNGRPARLMSCTTAQKTRPAPLPYNLLKLQMDAARLFGLKPDQVKDITQALREKHRLITYNRSDCQYLSEEQHGDAPGVLRAVARNLADMEDHARAADPAIKSRAFDSSKVSAHHAIIPTEATPAMGLLSPAERSIYTLIARAYVAQFHAPHAYDQTDFVIEAEGHRFTAQAKVTTAPGWTVLYGADASADEDEDNVGQEDGEEEGEQASGADLRGLSIGAAGQCRSAAAERRETKPAALYTLPTLLAELTRVARHIKDDRLRKILVEKDKDKKGEHGGIGTPATRDAIIKNLFERGYLAMKGKNVISTPAARAFYDVLPDQARFPDMTALWHEQQRAIADGRSDIDKFLTGIASHIAGEIQNLKAHGLDIKATGPTCPQCKRPLKRWPSKQRPGSFYWSCTGYPDCKYSCDDKGGKPVPRAAPPPVSDQHKCHACGSGLRRRPSPKEKGKFFWACSGFPKCKQTYRDVAGKPLLPAKP